MKNVDPIFLNCFTQGGSNILWNMIVSHPGIASPKTETHSCFENGYNLGMNKTKRPLHWIVISWTGVALFCLTRQHRFFDVRYSEPRKPIGRLAQTIIDHRMFKAKCSSIDEPGYKYKFEGVLYSQEELANNRLCSKGNNGLVFLNDIFRSMYPGVRFVGMTRHPLSLYESWSRRNVVRSPEEFCVLYNTLAGEMVRGQSEGSYLLITFERLMSEPVEILRELYSFLGLSLDNIEKIRLKAKKHYQKDGEYGTPLIEGHYYWFDLDKLPSYFSLGVKKQVAKIDDKSKKYILEKTSRVRDIVGYGEGV